MNQLTSKILILSVLIITNQICQAGSATWVQTPADNNWSNPSNWMPNTVPNSTTDTATFGPSDITAISIQDSIDVASVTF